MHVESTKKAWVRAHARKLYQGDYTMFTQQIAKPSFTQSKAYGLCGTLALATALLIGARAVSADETAQPVVDTQPAVSNVYTADNAGNITVTPSETVAETPKVLAPAPVESQPIAETPVATTEVTQPGAETPAVTESAPVATTETAPATTVTKQGDTINVENPNVEVTFPNGNGKYSPFEVKYKDIQIPNDAPILDLPELHIPEEPTPEKPSTPEKAPKTSVDKKAAQSVAVSYNLAPVSKETPKTAVYGGTLPSTGEKEGIASTLGLVVIAAGITALTLGFKKYNEDK